MTTRPSESHPSLDVQRIVDLVVFAPIGLGAAIVEDGPDAFRRARQELRNARFIGRFAVDRGVAELRRRFDAASAPTTNGSVAEPAEDPTSPAPAAPGNDLQADDLALPDYDTLPAIDIVDKLQHLSASERSAIGQYERAHRRRRTVLGKLEQLADA